jgi:diguanylate cyclase (GGDEF)-like protein
MRILIADDDEVVVAALSGLLRHLGHEAVIARDGLEAWNLIQREDAPSLVILDWLMPGFNGIEICRRIRRSTDRPYQYVIMLTAKDDMRDLVESIESGADDYLSKPFDERELRVRLRAGERILALRDELNAKATIDELTGLFNRAGILARLQQELAIAERNDGAVSILTADLDQFKRINDTHGHPAGDEVLREASKRMAARLRPYDDIGRYGGEEFLAVLPGCTSLSAVEIAQRMRESISQTPIRTTAGMIEVTVSLGVATADDTARLTESAMISAADQALYRAKRNGRNRVELAPLR